MGASASAANKRTDPNKEPNAGDDDATLNAKATKRNEQIEKLLMTDRIQDSQRVKLLLLGGGESGKSTFAKQMRILHLNGFTESDLLSYQKLVYANAATALHQLLQAVHQLKIAPVGLTEHDLENFQLLTNSGRGYDYQMTPTIGFVIKRIWTSNAVQDAYARKTEFEILDSAKYFLDSIDRISASDYVPTADDILRTRAATLGIYEIAFTFRAKEFRMVDVGGQRTERRKWIHCFDNVTAILFISSLAEYDLFLSEDHTVNRLDDSLALFAFITKNPYFTRTAVLLFLNKKDILKEKVLTTPFTVWCPTYKGAQTYEAVSQAILGEFVKRQPPEKPFYSYFTDATDTKNVEIVFSASMDIILAKALASVGFN